MAKENVYRTQFHKTKLNPWIYPQKILHHSTDQWMFICGFEDHAGYTNTRRSNPPIFSQRPLTLGSQFGKLQTSTSVVSIVCSRDGSENTQNRAMIDPSAHLTKFYSIRRFARR